MAIVTLDSTLGVGTLSEDKLTITVGNGARPSTEKKTSGKWYLEVYRVTTTIRVQIGNELQNLSSGSGTVNANTIVVYNNLLRSQAINATLSKSIDDCNTIGVIIDFDEKKYSFLGDNEVLFTNDLPPTWNNVNIAVGGTVSAGSATSTVNFGASPFRYSIPKGHLSYDGSQDGYNKKLLLKSNNKNYSLKSEEILYETKMTSNTTPSPFVASASSAYSATYPAWKAFNGSTASDDAWASLNTKTGWIQIDFGSKKEIDSFSLRDRNNRVNFVDMPLRFELMASDDGVTFTTIQSFVTSNDWKVNETRVFKLQKSSSYRFYRLNILASGGTQSYVSIGGILFYNRKLEVKQLPTTSVENFINYGTPVIDNFDLISTSKNYILQDTASEDTDGLWKQELNRKPLSIKFE